jgi:O-antigen ligase
MLPPEPNLPPPDPAVDPPPATASAAGAGSLAWRRVTAAAHRVLPPLAQTVFWLAAVTIVLDRFPLPGGGSFGFRSLARNFVIVVILGHLAATPGLRFVPVFLAAPLVAYLGAAVLSVAINGEVWGDVRLLGAVVGFYVAARALAAGRGGSVLLLHWLGVLVVLQLVREVASQPELLLLREDLRNTLVTDHPNSLGHEMAVLLPLFVGVALRRDSGLLPLVYAVAAPIALLITFSRSAWGTTALGVVAIFVSLRRRTRTALQQGLLIGTVVVSAVIFVSISYLSATRTEADLQRLRIIEASLSLFRDHWLVGVGFGAPNFKDVFPARYLELYGEGLFLFHSHNTVVDVLACTGLIGAAAAAWVVWRLGALAVRALRVAPAASSPEGVCLAVSIAVFLAMGLFDVAATHPKLMFVFAVALAYIETRIGELAASQRGG